MKKIISILLAATLVITIAGCGKTVDSNNTTNVDDTTSIDKESTDTAKEVESEIKEKSKITIAIEATGDIPTEFQKQIERFNTASDVTKVEILTYAGAEAYETAIIGQVAGNTAPDIILLDGGKKIQEYAQQEVIAPLDDYLGDIADQFEESLIQACIYDGKLYGITKDYNTSVLFYQTEMLTDAGIEVPETMDDFRSAVEKLTTDDVVGFGCDPKLNYLYPFAVAMGADFVGEDGTIDKEKILSDEHKLMLQMFQDMFTNKEATSPYIANAGWDGELFGNKKVALLYAGSWVTGVIEDVSTAGVAALPQDKSTASMLYTTGWCITEQCDNKEAAAEVIRFLSSDEELVEGNKTGLIGLPPTMSAMEKLIGEKADDPFLPVYQEVVKDGVAFGLIDSKFTDTYNKAFEDMIYNNTSVDDTVETIVNAVK